MCCACYESCAWDCLTNPRRNKRYLIVCNKAIAAINDIGAYLIFIAIFIYGFISVCLSIRFHVFRHPSRHRLCTNVRGED